MKNADETKERNGKLGQDEEEIRVNQRTKERESRNQGSEEQSR